MNCWINMILSILTFESSYYRSIGFRKILIPDIFDGDNHFTTKQCVSFPSRRQYVQCEMKCPCTWVGSTIDEQLPCSQLGQDQTHTETLTLSLPNKLSSAKFLVCFNVQSSSISRKVFEHVVWESSSLDPDEMPSNSASHPNPSCLHMALCLFWLAG